VINVIGDATDPQGTGPRIIAHIVNDQGRWGRGFVVAISKRDPVPEQLYRNWFRNGSYMQFEPQLASVPFALGQIQLTAYTDTPEMYVANMVAQRGVRHYRSQPRATDYDALQTCLHRLAEEAARLGASVHMPRIGCGLGGGVWEEIEPLINDALATREVPVTVYDLPEPVTELLP
jgi:O-acetyl-ADP-ribose deacetylase (regulator of RNase III)